MVADMQAILKTQPTPLVAIYVTSGGMRLLQNNLKQISFDALSSSLSAIRLIEKANAAECLIALEEDTAAGRRAAMLTEDGYSDPMGAAHKRCSDAREIDKEAAGQRNTLLAPEDAGHGRKSAPADRGSEEAL